MFRSLQLSFRAYLRVFPGDIIVFRVNLKSAAPDNMNPWIPSNPNLGAGGAPHYEPLWYWNVTNG